MEYYVHLSDETLEKLEDAISGEPVEVVELNVTENDTYTAPSGKAYSPVVVNVSGGSSDFSTAEVTLNIAMGVMNPRFVAAFAAEGEYPSSYGEVHESGVYQLILYKGRGFGTFVTDSLVDIAVSGDIVYDDDFYITGSGAITITLSSPL